MNAGIHAIETMFVEEDDKVVNPLGVEGRGELGMVGLPAAIANAVFHATGKRIRELRSRRTSCRTTLDWLSLEYTPRRR